MTKNAYSLLGIAIGLLITLVINGCVSMPFHTTKMLEEKSFVITVTVRVTDLAEIKNKYNATGMAFLMRSGESEVLVSGYWYQGKLVFDRPETLGHEIIHILNWEYPDIITNPDE